MGRVQKMGVSVARRLPTGVKQAISANVPAVPWADVQQLRAELDDMRGDLQRVGTTKSGGVGAPELGLGSALVTGSTPFLDTALTLVRDLVEQLRFGKAQAIADSLRSDGLTAGAGALLTGVIASRRRFDALAVESFDAAGAEAALHWCPQEYVTSLLRADRPRATAFVRQLVDARADLPATVWWECVRYTFPVSTDEENGALVERLEEAYLTDPESWTPGAQKLPWLREWLGRPRNRTLPAVPGRVQLGVINYRQPDRSWSSRNIGDWIQTVAALGHVVRHQDLRFAGDDPELVQVVQELAVRVRPELQLTGIEADVDLHEVQRDASGYQEFPEGTWLLAFGWFMHPEFNVEEFFGLPFHNALRPIFVSFHCNKRAMLTPEVLDYLRVHGPIGCRDWTTVDLLLSLDVPAFFSGCLTTTVNTVFPDLPTPRPAENTAYVDVARRPVPAGRTNIPQQVGTIKGRSFERNIRDAVGLLEDYRQHYTRVVTTRLHCYLPATSIGLEVEFEPKNNADVRFNGLFRLNADEFEAVRTPMRDRLRPVLEAIFAGASEVDVRQAWWNANEADLALARERHARASEVRSRGESWRRSLARAAATPPDDAGEAVDVVMVPEANRMRHLAPVLRSAARHTSVPIRAWVLSGSAPSVDVEGVDVRWVDISALGSSPVDAVEAAKVAVADLIPSSRAVVLPAEAIVEDDLRELLALDLGDTSVAARDTSSPNTSGFGMIYRGGMRLDAEPQRAYELYRDAHARHRFDFDAFDPEVLVLDLDRLRESDASLTMLGAMTSYGFDAREAWHFLIGPDRTVLDPSWAYVPTRDPSATPRLTWWADGTKPWHPTRAPERERWRSLLSG